MNDFNQTYASQGGVARPMDMSMDAGLRAFMLGVYNKMGLGLLLSAAIAYAVGTYAPLTNLVFGTPLLYVVQWGPIALLFGSMFFMRNPSPAGSAALYWSIVTLIGAGLSIWVFAAQSGLGLQSTGGVTLSPTFTTIATAFVMTASAFGGLSLWGYTTKRDLTGLGSFLMMGVIGVLVLGLINVFFVQSGPFELIIQLAVLALMAGVVAWQTQTLKVSYYEIAGDERSMAVMTNMGALNLYIAFVNIFQVLMSLLSRE